MLVVFLSGCTSETDFSENEFKSAPSASVPVNKASTKEENYTNSNENFNLNDFAGTWKENKKENESYLSLKVSLKSENYAQIQIDHMSNGYKYIASIDKEIEFIKNKGVFEYDEDGFGNSGKISITLDQDTILLNVESKLEGDQGWGIQEGFYTLTRYDQNESSTAITNDSKWGNNPDNESLLFKFENGKFYLNNIYVGQSLKAVDTLLGTPISREYYGGDFEWSYEYMLMSLGMTDEKVALISYPISEKLFHENFVNNFSGDKYIAEYEDGDYTIYFHSKVTKELLYFKKSQSALFIGYEDWGFEEGLTVGYITKME